MIRIIRAVAVLGLGLAVFGAASHQAMAAPPLQVTEIQALRKGPPDGPSKPPKPKRLPSTEDLVSPIAFVDIG
jgi:hypothetical protein